MTNCGGVVMVDFKTDCMLVVVVDWTDVKTVGGNDVVVMGSDREDEAACSTSMEGGGSGSHHDGGTRCMRGDYLNGVHKAFVGLGLQGWGY
uniref:Uncharacterized protein n=1 Tax=Romanomermis culicivorax TaxID=13658 RepID=A0A915IY40_ROMCU